MSVTLAKVKKLLTAREQDFAASMAPKSLTGLKPAELRSKHKQATRLAGKYEDLARRQRREARGKSAPRGKRPSQSNQNTKLKAEFFAGLAERLERRLEKVAGEQGGAKKTRSGAKKTRSGAKKTGTKKATRKKTGGKKAGAGGKKSTGTRAASKETAPKARRQPRSRAASGDGFDEAHSVRRPVSAIRSAGAAPTSVSGGNGLVIPPAMGKQIEARKTRREQVHHDSLPARMENIAAQRPDRRIEGHVRSSVRRRQAARDSGGGD